MNSPLGRDGRMVLRVCQGTVRGKAIARGPRLGLRV